MLHIKATDIRIVEMGQITLFVLCSHFQGVDHMDYSAGYTDIPRQTSGVIGIEFLFYGTGLQCADALNEAINEL